MKFANSMKLLDLTNVDVNSKQRTNSGFSTQLNLTNSEVVKLEASGLALNIEMMSTLNRKGTLAMFPNTYNPEFNEWTPDDIGPVYIPKKGRNINLNARNIAMYRRVITAFEGHSIKENSDGTVLIDGELTSTYTFEQSYYWMMGDNRHNSADSRMWGFVPEDHIIGCASFTWFSKQNKAQHGESKIRWNRMFKTVQGV